MHLDALVRQASDPRTSHSERYDLNSEIWKTFGKDLPYPDLDEIRDWIPGVVNSQFAKAAMPLGAWKEQHALPSGHPREHVSILQVDEFGNVDLRHSRWLEKRSGAGFAFLKDVRNSVDLIDAVIFTRKRQITPFLRPERAQGPLGFHFVRVDGEKIGDRDRRAVARLEQMLLCSGDEPNYFERQTLGRDSLVNHVAKVVMDTLTADACPIELVRTNGGKMSGWHSLAFDSIRLCTEAGYQGDDRIRAVQIKDDIPYVAYGYRDILYEIRNPRTDLIVGGYGMGEAECVVRAMTGYMNAVTYNMAGIDRNSLPRGFVTLIGKYDQKGLGAFQKQFHTMMRGPSQRHNVPILASEDKTAGAIWTPMDQFDEMYFARWMVFLVSIVCAVYGIDPNEIHFDSFNVRTSSLSGSDTTEKLALSRDKGLVPLLMFIEDLLNVIVAEIDPRYRLEFVGLHGEDEDRKHERIVASSTVKEIREMDGKEPIGNQILDNAPTNPSLLAPYMQSIGIGDPEAGGPGEGEQTDPKGGEKGEGEGEDGKPDPSQAEQQTLIVDSEDEFRKAAIQYARKKGFTVIFEREDATGW